MNPQWLGFVAVMFAALLWGTTGTVASFAPNVGPLAIAAVSMGCGGILQAAIAITSLYRARAKLRPQWGMVLFGAVAVALYPIAFYGSMHFAGVAVGTVVSIGSAPILSAVIENRLEGAPLSRRWLFGSSLGVIGILLLALADHHSIGKNDSSALPVFVGLSLGFVAGATYAAYSWSARQLMLNTIPPQAAMGATFGLGGLLLMPLLFSTGAPLLTSWQNASVGVYMALFPMFLGYLCYGLGLARIKASTATSITLLEPVVAALLAVFIIGEKLALIGWGGIGLIIVSLGVITSTPKTKPPSTN